MAPTTLTPMASSLLRSSRLAVRPAMASLRAPAAVRYSSHDHHGPQVTEPPLLTWGVPAGQKRPKEAWEGPFKFFVAGFVMFALMGWLRPDTSCVHSLLCPTAPASLHTPALLFHQSGRRVQGRGAQAVASQRSQVVVRAKPLLNLLREARILPPWCACAGEEEALLPFERACRGALNPVTTHRADLPPLRHVTAIHSSRCLLIMRRRRGAAMQCARCS